MILTPDERHVAFNFWAGLVAFGAVLYLTGGFWKATVIGAFVLTSCALGFGRRWLLPGTLVLAVAASLIAIGAPSPDQWLELIKQAHSSLFARAY
jgi:hypothetical protein